VSTVSHPAATSTPLPQLVACKADGSACAALSLAAIEAELKFSADVADPLSFTAQQVHVPAMRAQRDLGFHLSASFLAESPSSMSRLKASALDGKSSCFRRQASMRSIIVVSRRISKRSVLRATDMSVCYVHYSVLYGT
jgi:hypothetical protein